MLIKFLIFLDFYIYEIVDQKIIVIPCDFKKLLFNFLKMDDK